MNNEELYFGKIGPNYIGWAVHNWENDYKRNM